MPIRRCAGNAGKPHCWLMSASVRRFQEEGTHKCLLSEEGPSVRWASGEKASRRGGCSMQIRQCTITSIPSLRTPNDGSHCPLSPGSFLQLNAPQWRLGPDGKRIEVQRLLGVRKRQQ